MGNNFKYIIEQPLFLKSNIKKVINSTKLSETDKGTVTRPVDEFQSLFDQMSQRDKRVAEEVQRPAERSTSSTKQIETLVKNVQGEINEAGTRMEEIIQRVVEGSNLVNDAHRKRTGPRRYKDLFCKVFFPGRPIY